MLSWRRHIRRLVKALEGIPERGWRQTKASYRRRGKLIRDRLVELNGGVPLSVSGPLLEGDRMLRFVQEMVLPWGRMQLRRVRTLTPLEAAERNVRFQIRQVKWFKWYLNYALPIDVDKEKALRHKQWACPKCVYQGFELTRALVAAVPGGARTVRILWAIVRRADVSKNSPYGTLMKEFDGMLGGVLQGALGRRSGDAGCGGATGGMWLAAQSIGKDICCDAWKYSLVLRQKPGQRDPHEYGVYGIDDAGICTLESVWGRWAERADADVRQAGAVEFTGGDKVCGLRANDLCFCKRGRVGSGEIGKVRGVVCWCTYGVCGCVLIAALRATLKPGVVHAEIGV